MNQKALFILAIIATFTRAWRPNYSLNKDKVLYAINCGSDKQFTSRDGFIYQAVRKNPKSKISN